MTRIDDHPQEVPDRWVRTFTEAARTGSFTVAARGLGVSQPAVSHTIRRLEQVLGVTLFQRHKGGVTLTRSGAELLAQAGPALDQLDNAVTAARATGLEDKVVALSVSTSLASYWLMPRLHLFKADYTDIDLKVITNDTDRGVGLDDADLWVPLGLGPWLQLQSWDLFTEKIYPVATQDYQREHRLSNAMDAPTHIHLEERYTPRFDWDAWSAHTNTTQRANRGPTSNDYSLVIQSAVEGQGVALGWHHIVGALIEEGRLIRIGPDEVTTNSSFPVLAKQGRLRPEAKLMLDWLLQQAAET
jgi:molybdate transport repressor ModE-like protein